MSDIMSAEGMTSDDESVASTSIPELTNRRMVPIASGYPVSIWAPAILVAPGLIDTVSSNLRSVLNALGIPAVSVLYYRMRCTAAPGESSHLFVAVDDRERVIRVPPARLAMITSTVDVLQLKLYTASVTADPLGSLLVKISGGGERMNRFPPMFGFKMPKGERQLLDRRIELEALRRDGYIGLIFLPVPGVDHRVQLTSEIASLWGFSLVATEKKWPDLLVLRNDLPERVDFGGVPDETWLSHALSRVQEDHLPVVEIDGLWMGSLPRPSFESRALVFYAILSWVRVNRLPYITARTFHCYVRRDLSAVVALGSLRDRNELISFLESFSFDSLSVERVKGEAAAALVVFGGRVSGRNPRDVAIRDAGTDSWLVVHGPSEKQAPVTGGKQGITVKEMEQMLRDYYGSAKACSAPGSPISAADIAKMLLPDLVKVIRIAECEASKMGVCILGGDDESKQASRAPLPAAWTISHRAYRSAIRTHVLRTHDSLGVFRLGMFGSPFFSFEIHQYAQLPQDSRYVPVVSQISLSPDQGAPEDALLKSLVGTVWQLTVKETATESNPATEVDVIHVATDRESEEVKKLLFSAWRSGHLIGTWCRVMLTHREALSISVAGGTVDPLLAHAGDSVADGNRWLDVTRRAITECSI